jgi:hypothetical protein
MTPIIIQVGYQSLNTFYNFILFLNGKFLIKKNYQSFKYYNNLNFLTLKKKTNISTFIHKKENPIASEELTGEPTTTGTN